MSERLLQRFHEQATRALRWKPSRDATGRDATPVLEALGSALFLHVTGALHRTDSATRRRLAAVGAEVLLSRGRPDAARDDDEALAADAVTAIARAGRAALSGESVKLRSSMRIHPPTLTLTRMFYGEADGLTCGRYAAHIAHCEECLGRLEALRFVESTQRSSDELSVAAAASAQVRDPSDGRKVAALDSPALEAVLFADGRLAVYADGNEPLRLVAEGVTTEQTLGGYWLGRVPEGAKSIDAVVHFAGSEHAWKITLGAGK